MTISKLKVRVIQRPWQRLIETHSVGFGKQTHRAKEREKFANLSETDSDRDV